ncbi:hypothetical protein LCGC14_2884460, partial [marine sediment metagenome]
MPHRKGHKKEDLTDPLRPGAGRPARGQDIETTPKVFKINDRVVSEEEFGAESIKLRSQAEGERIRQAGGIGPEEIAARKERRAVIERQPGREIEAGVALEEAGAFEEVTPKEVSLVPEETLAGKIPVIGPTLSAIGSAIGDVIKDTPFAGEGITTGKEAFPQLTEETIRELALREIRQ